MDTTKDTTMQHVTDVTIAEIKRAAEHPLRAPVIVSADVMLGVLAQIEQLESDLATAEQDSRQKQARIERLEKERDALRAKIEQMEKQKPVAWLHETRRDSDVVTDAVKHVWGKAAVGSMAAYSIPLYALPGAKGE